MPIPFLNQIDLAKLATAVTPDSSAVSLYAKSDDNLYIKRSNGTELQLLTSLDIGGISGTTNYIPKFTAANQLGNSIIYETGGKIGIGTTAPSVTLDVNGQIRSRSATGTAPLVIASTTLVSNLNADLLDGFHGSSYLKFNDVIQNTNPFGGKRLYINSLDNALAGASKKYYVTATTHKKEVGGVTYPKAINSGDITLPQWEDSPVVSTLSPDTLFDNYYEGGLVVNSDEYLKVVLNFSADGLTYFAGYPYGTYYLSYYYTFTPDRAEVRCYNGYAAHTIGYKTNSFIDFFGTNADSNYIQQCTDSGNYYRRQIEFIIYGHPDHTTILTEIEWKLSRPNFGNNSPIFTNYNTNRSYQEFQFGTQDKVNVIINPNGDLTSKRFISTVATGTAPLTIASTTLNTNLNADLLDGQHGSYYTGYVQARGMNLVSNGSGLMGSNYNFSTATYDQTDVHGGLGSFAKSTGPSSVLSDEYIPVDVEKYYVQSIWAKAGDNDGVNYTPLNRMYIGISERDIDGYNIEAAHASKHPTAVDTELATALNIGDTVVNLDNGTGWTLSTKHFLWFPYTNSKGYTYPLYGYSRNYTRFLRSEYNSNTFTAINGNVLTLAAPWPGPALPAGTPIRQSTSGGGTYKYFYSAFQVPNSWTNYKTTIRPAPSDYLYSATRFYNGTAYIQILILFNYGSEQCIQRISDVWFSEISANNLDAFQVPIVSSVVTGTAPLTIASTTLNTNLNADLLDGYHASSFALAGSGVTSFNTRTGAVSLTKADVEAVLTGVITSHTHNYGTGTVTSVGMTVPTGLAVNPATITTSGTFALTYASGYAIPTIAKQTEWDAAYAHSQSTHQTIINGTGFVKANGTTLSYDNSTYALNTHTHTQYVNKTGDIMSGNLSIMQTGASPGSDSHYHLASQSSATDAMQAWFEVSSYTNSGTASIRAIRTQNSVITEHILISAVSGGGGGKSLYVGDDTFYRVYLHGPAVDVVANITHVLGYGTDGIKRIPVADITGGSSSGVTSFNTRTGAVTLLQADVEAVLTGNINTHSHDTYVLKAGDTMTGNLLIHKTNSGSVNAQFGIKADATSNRYHEFRITSISDSDIYETALQMFTPTPTIYSMLIGSVSVDRGAQLSLGGANWDSLSIYAATDVIGNASYVYVSDTSDHVKKVPVSSFGGGSGTVTSVGLSMPNIFSVSNSPVTTSGTLTATLVSQTKNHVLVAPQFANGVPTFRKLTADDMPDLSAMYDNYYCWNARVNSGTTSQIISASQTPSTGQYKGIRFVEGTGITLSETNVSGILNLKIEANGSSGADNYEAWTLKYSVDGVPTSIPINSINSSGNYRTVRFGGSGIDILPQSEPNNTMALVFKVNITPLEAVLTSNYGLTTANSDYNVLTVSNVPAGTYLAVVDSLGYHSTPSSTCTIIHRLRSSTGTNYLSTAVGNITGVSYRKGNMSGIITLTGTTTLYLTCRSTITGNSIYAGCGYGNNATRVTLIKLA
jgi:hypothetical protein